MSSANRSVSHEEPSCWGHLISYPNPHLCQVKFDHVVATLQEENLHVHLVGGWRRFVRDNVSPRVLSDTSTPSVTFVSNAMPTAQFDEVDVKKVHLLSSEAEISKFMGLIDKSYVMSRRTRVVGLSEC